MESVVTADAADRVCTVHIKLTETAHNGVVICSLDVFLVVSWCASVYGVIKNNIIIGLLVLFVCACVCVCLCVRVSVCVSVKLLCL